MAENDGAAPPVVVNEAEQRFELQLDGRRAVLEYVRRGDRMYLVHTEVPEELEGRGYGTALARAALEHARREQLRVVPRCPFVRSFMERHPEYAELSAGD
jgi:predicted GNAT family acetyltransferase